MNKWIAEFELEDGDTMLEHMDLEYKGVRIDFHCKPLEQEPRKGHWIYDGEGSGYKKWHCSNCKMLVRNPKKPWYNFCPNCGSDNKEEVEE